LSDTNTRDERASVLFQKLVPDVLKDFEIENKLLVCAVTDNVLNMTKSGMEKMKMVESSVSDADESKHEGFWIV